MNAFLSSFLSATVAYDSPSSISGLSLISLRGFNFVALRASYSAKVMAGPLGIGALYLGGCTGFFVGDAVVAQGSLSPAT